MRIRRYCFSFQLVGLLVSPILAGQQPATDETKKPSLETSSMSAATVPVTIKAVRQGSLAATSKTILTVKTEDGRYVISEVVPNSEGIAQLELSPGKYLLSAIGAKDSLAFVVTPTRSTFTIQVSESGEPIGLSEGTLPSSGAPGPIGTDKILAFGFGVAFVLVMLGIAAFDRQPSPMGIVIYRVVLALAAAGIGAVVPGMIAVNVSTIIRAGGALALFVIVYWFKPAGLVAGPRNIPSEPPSQTDGIHETSKEQLEQLTTGQKDKLFESMERFKSLPPDCKDKVFKAIEIKRTITIEPPNAELIVTEDLMNLSDRDQVELTRHVTTDAPTAKRTLGIKAWIVRENQETDAAVEVHPSTDGRVFSIRISFKGQVVRVGKTIQLRWKCKFPASVARDEDYWVFPLNFYRKRPDKLVVEALFSNIPEDLLFFAITDAGFQPLSLTGPESRTKEEKPYFAYSASIDGPCDFYVLQWRTE
jgi:hypothetical protein